MPGNSRGYPVSGGGCVLIAPVHDEKGVTIYHGDCVEVMQGMADNSVDSIVTDPPYGIRFMGKAWDGADIEKQTATRRSYKTDAPGAGPQGGHNSKAAAAGKYDRGLTANQAFAEWTRVWCVEALRVLKPGGHMLIFCGPRTYHRMASGVEDAGFEIRDQIMWIYGSGFPKSLDVSKAIDKAAGVEREVVGESKDSANRVNGGIFVNENEGQRTITAPATEEAKQWDGWGTALKPAHEPICVARKPLTGTVAENVLEHGTGGLNIDACRIEGPPWKWGTQADLTGNGYGTKRPSAGDIHAKDVESNPKGRWPANLILDTDAGAMLDRQSGELSICGGPKSTDHKEGMFGIGQPGQIFNDSGGASRFFYCAKASKEDRDEGLEDFKLHMKKMGTFQDGRPHCSEDYKYQGQGRNHHPTVKPTDLMQYLCRLVTPPGGTVFDPFMGSGSTGKGAVRENFKFIGIDNDKENIPLAIARINAPAQVELI